MISSSTFYQLTFSVQANLLSEQGLFINTRCEDNFVVDLYELDELLVEVYYQKESEELVSVLAYSSTENLKTFTKGADLRPRLVMKTGNTLENIKEYAA